MLLRVYLLKKVTLFIFGLLQYLLPVVAVSAITRRSISYESSQYLLYPHRRYFFHPWEISRPPVDAIPFPHSNLSFHS